VGPTKNENEYKIHTFFAQTKQALSLPRVFSSSNKIMSLYFYYAM